MCFGFEVPLDALLEISNLINEMLRLSKGSLAALSPYLRVFENKTQRQARALRVRQVQIFTSHVEKHKELAKHGQLGPGSYLETLLHMDAKTALSMDDIVSLCTELLVGGIDTTVTTLEWTMACLVTDPQIQSKLYNLNFQRGLTQRTLPLSSYKGDSQASPTGPFIFASFLWTKEVTRMIALGAGRRIFPGLGLASMHLELFNLLLAWCRISCGRIYQELQWTWMRKPGSTVRIKYHVRALVKKRGPSQVL
ncbi:hypothetical protein L7F22_063625 [Adiantum nelumboides]|nr:hypothetical protein [Adiantum nelumboides]